MKIKSNGTWGSFIRKNYGDEAYNVYRKNYNKIYRYSKKISQTIDVARESAMSIIYGDTKTLQAVKLTKGITNTTDVQRITDLNRLSDFIDKHSLKQIYGTKDTINDIVNRYKDNKISREEFLNTIKIYKKSPYYLVNGS